MLKPLDHQKDHSNCIKDYCKLNQIDEQTYKTRHASLGCACNFVGPNMLEVAEILQSGGIPVIAIKTMPDNRECRLRVVSVQPGQFSRTPFVAISHVWGDGMGNAKANALPTCQIRRLKSLVEPVYSKISNCCNSSLEPRAGKLGDDTISLDDSFFKAKLRTAPAILSYIRNPETMTQRESSSFYSLGPQNTEAQDMVRDVFGSKEFSELGRGLPHIGDVQAMIRELSTRGTFDNTYTDLISAYKRQYPGSPRNHEQGYSQSKTLIDLSKADNAEPSKPSEPAHFLWLVNNAWNRDFMPHHGSSGKFDLDWKLFDQKCIWEYDRLLREVDMGDEVLI